MIIVKYLHIPESISLQRHVISLDGPVVTASGFKDNLALVTHASDCLSSNDQVGSAFMEGVASETSIFSMVLPSSTHTHNYSKFLIILLSFNLTF